MRDEAIRAAENGHNILIFGSAGTGKTVLVRKIYGVLKKSGRNVQLTGSTGISGSLLGGTTIHRFLGLKDGRYTDRELVTKILHDTSYTAVKERIRKTDCIIIDEISMLSWKLFLQIEYACRIVRGENDRPFGGVQMILSGDFYQLKPVSNPRYNDLGEVLISKKEFTSLVPHHFHLQRVHRQQEGI